MTVPTRIVDLLVSQLPPAARERYREEWQADLAGAAELGLPRTSVLLGAIATVIAVRGHVDLGNGPSTAARWHLLHLMAVLSAAGGFAFAAQSWGALGSRPGLGTIGAVGSVACWVVAGFGVLRALVVVVTGPVRRHGPVLVGLSVGAILLASGLLLYGSILMLLLGFAMVVVAIIVAWEHAPRSGARAGERRRTRPWSAIALVGTVAAVVALTVADILVWYPLAAVPGMSLAEIRAGVAAAGETNSDVGITVWATVWLVIVTVVAAPLGWSKRPSWRSRPYRTMAACLVVLGANITSFGPATGIKMGLGDSLAGYTGVFTPVDPLLTTVGAIAFATAVHAGLATRREAEPQLAGSATSTGI